VSASVPRAGRARGANRGGCGGGYEATDPDYNDKRLASLRREYKALEPQWRTVFLSGLSRFEQDVVTGRRKQKL